MKEVHPSVDWSTKSGIIEDHINIMREVPSTYVDLYKQMNLLKGGLEK